MIALAYGALAAYFALAFGLRSWLHWRRTGSTGFRGISGAVGSVEWLGGVLFVVALVAAVLAPVAEDAGIVRPWEPLRTPAAGMVGVALAALGLVGTLWAQAAMGDAWRIGVDADERTRLALRGPFRLVRNPIFTSMLVGLTGIALLTPNVIALVAMVTLVIALELHVRRVEEPHLLTAHGESYRAYAAVTGRFVPGLGRFEARR